MGWLHCVGLAAKQLPCGQLAIVEGLDDRVDGVVGRVAAEHGKHGCRDDEGALGRELLHRLYTRWHYELAEDAFVQSDLGHYALAVPLIHDHHRLNVLACAVRLCWLLPPGSCLEILRRFDPNSTLRVANIVTVTDSGQTLGMD